MMYKPDCKTVPLYAYLTLPLRQRRKSFKKMPHKVMQNIRTISVQNHRNAAIDYNDVLWTWGAEERVMITKKHAKTIMSEDIYGNISEHTNLGQYSNDVPQRIIHTPQKKMEDASSISVGAWHYMCITNDGKLWGWGENNHGELGLGDFENRAAPVFIMDNVKKVFAFHQQTYAIKMDDSLWGWGFNDTTKHYGSNLLLGAPDNCCTPSFILDHVLSFSAGDNIAMAIRTNGELWGWGCNMSDIIFPCDLYKICPPTLLMKDVESVAVSHERLYCLVVVKNSDLYVLGEGNMCGGTFGWTIRPRRGIGPIKVMENVAATYTGHFNSLILLRDGRLFSSGTNAAGQCRAGYIHESWNKPRYEKIDDIIEAGAGHHHSMALQSNGDLWIWGGDYDINENA